MESCITTADHIIKYTFYIKYQLIIYQISAYYISNISLIYYKYQLNILIYIKYQLSHYLSYLHIVPSYLKHIHYHLR